jgi:hypothetical protein
MDWWGSGVCDVVVSRVAVGFRPGCPHCAVG